MASRLPGRGRPAKTKGLDFYNRLSTSCWRTASAVCDAVSWDLPQALQDRFGGWTSRDTSKAFADYAAYVTALERPREALLHHQRMLQARSSRPSNGADAPGLKLSPSDVKQVRHNVALGHGLAVQAIPGHGRRGIRVVRRRMP
jgi:beta-glucosidase